MKDLEHILPLWRELESRREEFVLATVVGVEGSSYRKPGACMLLAQDGRRAGTVSGGCLEAAVARKAWWLTENGPALERYSTLDDDGDLPYGSGCGGVVRILLERSATAAPFLRALEAAFEARIRLGVATLTHGSQFDGRAVASSITLPECNARDGGPSDLLAIAAAQVLQRRESFETALTSGTRTIAAHYYAARPGLWVFGAGDDARPLVNLARELGWYVAVADGRAHLATLSRFANANAVHALAISQVPGPAWTALDIHPSDAVVLLTHSFEQDARVLAALMQTDTLSQPAYIGVLGPQRRTREALAEAARILGRPADPTRIEAWLEKLHAPTGIDLGAEAPAAVALSILAEVQKVLTASTGRPLRDVRAVPAPVLS